MAARVLAMRHGRTEWNVTRRIQGRRDEPLSKEGRALLRGARLPVPFRSYAWISSPLCRCVETARLLGGTALEIEPRIIEMDWGRWEGWSLAALRAHDPEGMRANEGRGLDFLPPGGESPRQVQARVSGWLDDVAAAARDVVMLSHKGVLRVLLSSALGWDMTSKPPVKLDWECAHLFVVDPEGRIALDEANIPLVRSDRAPLP